MNNDNKLEQIKSRIQQLGFYCPNVPPTHVIAVPVYALLCMPMHYVAAALMLKTDEEVPESVIEDLFGVKNVREAFSAENVVSELPVSETDANLLRKYLVHRRPVDSIIYDFALDTISQFFEVANDDVVELAKTIVARTVVAIAHASGEGWFGSGSKASPEQNEVISLIYERLNLADSPTAKEILDALEKDVLS
jgi:hypothetical protein